MGNIYSGRWANVKRRVLVEQCARRNAAQCPKCFARVRFVYALPQSASPKCFSGWACKKCHRLSYKSQHAKALENHKRRVEFAHMTARAIQGTRYVEAINYAWANGGDFRAPTMELEPETAGQSK